MSQIKFSLTEMTKHGSQKYLMGEIFEKNKCQWITKREVEKQLVFRWSYRNINNIEISTIKNIDDLIEISELVPGDIQRDVRLFYDKFRKYGLEKKEKTLVDEMSYKWNPINKCMANNIEYPASRNIFKTQTDIDKFYISKKNNWHPPYS